MKDLPALRHHIFTRLSVPNLLGTKSYGALSEPAITVLPDPQYDGNGWNPPEIINGFPVIITGISVVIMDTLAGLNFTSMLNNELKSDSSWSVIVEDWSGNRTQEAAEIIAAGLYLVGNITPMLPNKHSLIQYLTFQVGYSKSVK